jgi:hypothetical protein
VTHHVNALTATRGAQADATPRGQIHTELSFCCRVAITPEMARSSTGAKD